MYVHSPLSNVLDLSTNELILLKVKEFLKNIKVFISKIEWYAKKHTSNYVHNSTTLSISNWQLNAFNCQKDMRRQANYQFFHIFCFHCYSSNKIWTTQYEHLKIWTVSNCESNVNFLTFLGLCHLRFALETIRVS